jgi:hypothetical protein
MPSVDFTSVINQGPPPAATLRIESEPPGADAKLAAGPSCRTPCALQVPSSGEFTVSFALNGFLPQTVPVRALPVDYREGGGVRFDPSPVFAQLEPAPPPVIQKKLKKRPPKTATSGITEKRTQQ